MRNNRFEQCSQSVASQKRSGFQAVGQGGLGVNRFEIGHSGIWEDVREPQMSSPRQIRAATPVNQGAIVEAQGWIQQSNGVVQLRSPVGRGRLDWLADHCQTIGQSLG